MTFTDQAINHADHFRNMLSSIGHNGRFKIIEGCHVFKIGLRIPLGKRRNIFTKLCRGLHNFVVNISDIARI